MVWGRVGAWLDWGRLTPLFASGWHCDVPAAAVIHVHPSPTCVLLLLCPRPSLACHPHTCDAMGCTVGKERTSMPPGSSISWPGCGQQHTSACGVTSGYISCRVAACFILTPP